MKRMERIIWIAVVALIFVVSMFGVFTKDVWAGNINQKKPYFKKLLKVLNRIEADYVDEEKISHEDLINGAIEGMLEALDDPHTAYLDRDDWKDLYTTARGNYSGVGMIIGERNDSIVVITPLEGYPAYSKGIRAGDIILAVDGQSLLGLSVEDAANLLRGKAGTIVKVEVLHDDISFEVEIKRARIDLPSVKYDYVKEKYGFLRITQFAGTTGKYVREALIDFKKNKVEGIIIDLRLNPGGMLGQVIDIVDYFINEGDIVSIKGRHAYNDTVYTAKDSTTLVDKNIPIIVLIDEGSASASEIFSGAIKDHNRGILIGEKTYGKGSVQNTYPLENDGFKMTIAKYYTPSGTCIHGVGIEPDIEIKEPALTDDEKVSLQKLYKDKVIDKAIEKNSDPTDKEIDALVEKIQKEGYALSDRYLKKLIKNAAEFDDDKKEVYDLDFDIQLQKSLHILENNLLERKDEKFYLIEE